MLTKAEAAWRDTVVQAAQRALPEDASVAGCTATALQRWGEHFDRDRSDLGEVALTAAAASGHLRAMRAFEHAYVEPAAAVVRRRGLDADEVAEVLQRVRVRLFVDCRKGAPVIVGYAGEGRLAALVRVVAIREAIRLQTAPRAAPLALEDLSETQTRAILHSPAHQRVAKQAFERAAKRLSQRDRSVLRLHYARGVKCARIAAMFGVHRVTAARWIESARSHLLQKFSTELRDLAPGLSRSQRERFDAWFDTNVELSLSRVLASAA